MLLNWGNLTFCHDKKHCLNVLIFIYMYYTAESLQGIISVKIKLQFIVYVSNR